MDWRYHGESNRRGVTLIELLAVVVLIGVLATMAIGRFQDIKRQAMNTRAIGDIRALQIDIFTIAAGGNPLPASLAAIGRGSLLDPWGEPYQYLPFPLKNGKVIVPGGARKDRFLVPINSTFDLYSKGADRVSAVALTAKSSQDDIVRGNDGGFVGLASRF